MAKWAENSLGQAKLVQSFNEDLLALLVLGNLLLKEAVLYRLLDPDRTRFLGGTARGEDDAGVGCEGRLDEWLGAGEPPNPPAGRGEGLSLWRRSSSALARDRS